MPGVDDVNLITPENTTSINRLNFRDANIGGRNLIQDFSDINNFKVYHICSAFAMLELCIKENLTSSLTTSLGGMDTSVALDNIMGWGNDTHDVGSVVTLLAASKYYYAILSCLTELKYSIGDKFSKTILQVQGEFNRTPRTDESGSDHDSANVISFFSGKISNGPYAGGPAEIGNVGTRGRRHSGDYGSIQNLDDNEVNHQMDIFDALGYHYGKRAGGRDPEPAFYINENGSVTFMKALRNTRR